MRRRIALFALALSLLAGRASAGTRMMTRQTDAYFSTVSMLCLYVEDGAEAEFERAWAQVKALLGEIERAVSVSEPESDIARFNALACGEEIAISPLTARLLDVAFEAYESTGGLYDPTVYPLVDLWGFSPRFNRNAYAPQMPYDRAYEDGRLPLPRAEDIDALLPLVGLDGIAMTRRDGQAYLRKETPPVEIDGTRIQAQLDLGGIAKGFACDLVIAMLRESGYAQGHFVCGGSSLAVMSRPTQDGLYELTIGKPRAGVSAQTHYATFCARDVGVSTSVDVSHSFELDGVTYCHVIDPRTGWPINMPGEDGAQAGLAAATLLGDSAALCDALTTALLVMGPQEAPRYLARAGEERAVLVAFRDGADALQVLCGAGIERFALADEGYVPAPDADGTDGKARAQSLFAP